MRHRVPKDGYRSNWDIALFFLLLAVGMTVIGLRYLSLMLYFAMPLFFVAAVFLSTRRRRRYNRDRDERQIILEDLF